MNEKTDKRKQYRKEYYQDNKDKILEYQSVKVKCELCDKIMNKGNLRRHKKTIHNI